jgi:beta-lactamase superfamily II metal-dependent hydrolase
MFTIELLPAQRGDCLWLTYGATDEPHHVLIDAGPNESAKTLVPELNRRIKALAGRKNAVELLVVSHVDADHVQGVVALLEDRTMLSKFGDVWFNGFQHLVDGLLGGPDGERLTGALNAQPKRWNKAFGGGAVVVPEEGELPRIILSGGLEITLLTPRREALRRLAPEWEKECAKAGILVGREPARPSPRGRESQILGFDVDVLAAAPYQRDGSVANATSISMIARYGKASVLLTADAPAEELLRGLKRAGRLGTRFTAVKMPHHGSRRNTNLDLCRLVTSERWLVSTNGAVYKHPDLEAIARVVVTQNRPTIALNYATNLVADLIAGQGERYKVSLPRQVGDTYGEGIVVSLV